VDVQTTLIVAAPVATLRSQSWPLRGGSLFRRRFLEAAAWYFSRKILANGWDRSIKV